MTSIAPGSFHQTLSPATSGAGHPLPFAPTLGDRPTSRPSATGSRMATPLAAPPPPLNLTANPASTNLGRRVPFAGAEHTLGPTFSDEEDGDDSEWLANKMAVLGLNPQGAPYSSNNLAQRNATRAPHERARAQAQVQAQAQYDARVQQQQQLQYQQLLQLQSQAQQQQLIQAIILGQQTGQPTQRYREALAALQAQQAILATSQLQAQAHLVIQAQAERTILANQIQQQQQQQYRQQTQQQSFPYRDQQPSLPTHSENRSALAAQVQANLLARNNRSRPQPSDADIRARFESAPNTVGNAFVTPQTTSQPVFENACSPFGDATWKSHAAPSPRVRSPLETAPMRSTPSTMSRFSTAGGDSISTFLARRRATDESSVSAESEVMSVSTDAATMSRADTAQTSPNPSVISEKEKGKATAQAGLGNGRPASLFPSSRARTAPSQATQKLGGELTPRATSYAGGNVRTIFAVRQPIGPPGEAKELGEKNFQSRLRRQAGLNLGMLGRRSETPLTTLIIGAESP